MHRPTRRFVRVSHRGSMSWGFGVAAADCELEVGASALAAGQTENGRIRATVVRGGAKARRWL